jgi:hypothetical protein
VGLDEFDVLRCEQHRAAGLDRRDARNARQQSPEPFLGFPEMRRHLRTVESRTKHLVEAAAAGHRSS